MEIEYKFTGHFNCGHVDFIGINDDQINWHRMNSLLNTGEKYVEK